MTPAAPPQPNPVDLLNALTAEQIVARLDQIEAEAVALRVLLRAVNRRERSRRQAGPKPSADAKAVPA